MVAGIGFCHETDAGYDYRGLSRHNAQFVLFQYTVSGSGILDYERRSYELRPGDAMCLYFPHDNRYYVPAGGQWEFFYLCMYGREVERLWRELVLRTGPVISLREDSLALLQAARLCAQGLRGALDSPPLISNMVYSFVTQLIDETLFTARRKPAFVSRVKAYCKAHLGEPITVENLARLAGMSRYHFTRRFAEEEGVPPGAFLQELRMVEAARLLASGELSVKEVCAETGFGAANYFAKAFRKRFGVSPRAFRTSGMYTLSR
jgi:AraC-like DNA-binding protein